jgi:hypothetical protein
VNHRSIVVISLFVLLCMARATRAQSTDKDGFGDWQAVFVKLVRRIGGNVNCIASARNRLHSSKTRQCGGGLPPAARACRSRILRE